MASYPASLNFNSFDEPFLNTSLLVAFADEDEESEEESEEESSTDALEAIEDAVEEIEKAEIKIDESFDDGTDVSLSEEKLSEAIKLLEQAEISFDDGNFEDAEDLAEEAKDLASESRMKYLGKSLDNFEDDDFGDESDDAEKEFEIEIEVEIEDGIAKIESEFGDEKLEFEIKWIDEQNTIEEIALKTGLSLIQIESSISFEFEDQEEFDEENDKKSKQEKLADKQAKKEAKLLEKQARIAEKLAEKGAKLSEKSKLSEERANKLIQELEQKIQKMDERLQKLLDKYESGKYFGNLKNKDSVTNSFTLSFDGTALEINDSSNVSTVNGKLFLENQVTGKHIKKFRVTGGEIFVGDSDVYDVVFGKARLISGSGGDKNSMIVIGQVSNGVDVRTLKLNINLSESFDDNIESVDIEILSPRSKIASEWFLSGTGNLGLTESIESTESVETIPQENSTDETVNLDAQIPDVDIPVVTEISISTVESSYLTGDTIIISGMVNEIFENTPVIMQLISPVDLIEIAQIDVESDGVFTHTIVAQGTQWAFDGTYIIKVFYGANNVAETSFAFISEN